VTESDIVRRMHSGERDGFDTRLHLAHAKQQAVERNYDLFTIVDADAHHYELEHWPSIVPYIEDDVIRHSAEAGLRRNRQNLLYTFPGRQDNAGRLIRYPKRHEEVTDDSLPRDVQLIRREMQSIGIDYQIVFPTPMLELGLHPDPQIETAVSWAYTRWLTEEILPHDPQIKTLVYLPFNDPEACLRHIDYFGDKPGVVGFMVNAARYKPVHDNVFMPIYAAVEERGMPLGFHAHFHHTERMFEGMNKFISVHALGFVFFNMVHLTNLIFNGVPERFPNLKFMIIENGLAWLPFMMQRLDNEYAMRTSEAPLLTKKPSDYMREHFYFTSQPIENVDLEAMEVTFKMINAEERLLFSTDYPHWDFNLPSTIYDLPFLSEEAKRSILGGNALKVFGIDDSELRRAANPVANAGADGSQL
jgi:uncharacterized protein